MVTETPMADASLRDRSWTVPVQSAVGRAPCALASVPSGTCRCTRDARKWWACAQPAGGTPAASPCPA
eukprot:5530081-Alexandrium_andersonii.AAC.1